MPRMLSILLVIFYAAPHISSQGVVVLPGEWIIQVQNDEPIERLQKSIISPRVSSGKKTFEWIPLMKSPFNLWLLKNTDLSFANESLLDLIKGQKGVISIRNNRQILPRILPNDPEVNKQWHYINDGSGGGVVGADMDMDLAWDVTTGGITPTGDTIVICVIDDGMNALHEDLAGNVWINYKEIPGNGIDDDKNGYVDDYKGWNVSSSNDNVYSGGSHGTPVAGIIGAKGNNAKGVSGVNWDVKLMPVNYGFSTEANALASYGYVYLQRKLYNATNGAKGAFIVATNASWGVDELKSEDAPLWCSLFDSLGSVGILNCGATANSNVDVDAKGDMPTSCGSEFLISVTNLTRSDTKLSSAGYGRRSIDLGAYGHQVHTLTRTGYGTFGGTSGSTPQVTGVIGLLYSAPCNTFHKISQANPAAAALIAKDMILHGTLPIASMSNISTTGGKLNAARSVYNLMQLCQPCSPPAGIIIHALDEGFQITWQNQSGDAKVNIRYRPADKTSWTEILDIKKGHIVDGLIFCTEYEVQLGSDCGFMPGAYGYSKYFKSGGCCFAPVVKPLKTQDNTAGVEWTIIPDAAYIVGYQTNSGKWLDTLVNSSSFQLNNVEKCTAYTFRVQSKCAKYGNVSSFSPQIDVSTGCGSCTVNNYCPFGRKDASQEWVESFTINGITNKSGAALGGYRDFTGINQLSLKVATDYEFTITPGYAGSSFPDYYKIFIDLDQNGVFSTNEMVYTSKTAVSSLVKGTIKLPTTTINGYTRLRIIMSYEDFEGGCDTSKFEYGEVEDYCVQIINNVCPNNVQLKVSSIESTIIRFVKEPTSYRDTIRVSYRSLNSSVWLVVANKDSLVLKDLKACTTYEFRHQIGCGINMSDFSEIKSFTTACINSIEDTQIGFEIYPNPVMNQLVISSTSEFLMSHIDISDVSGQIVFSKNLLQNISTSSIDVQDFPSGIYFAKIKTHAGKEFRKKFIKL